MSDDAAHYYTKQALTPEGKEKNYGFPGIFSLYQRDDFSCRK